jgi:hypothetical protein
MPVIPDLTRHLRRSSAFRRTSASGGPLITGRESVIFNLDSGSSAPADQIGPMRYDGNLLIFRDKK